MKNIIKKSISILLCLVIMFSAFSVSLVSNALVNNGENEVMPLYDTFNTYTVGFDVSGFKAIASVSLTAQYSTNLKITIYLQKETSSGYETVETWTKSGTGTIINLEKTATANIFLNYRIKVTMVTGSETITVYRYE